MAFQTGWRNGQLGNGWSRYPESSDVSSQFKDIAGYNLGPVGFQKPNHNATSMPFYQNQNATSRPFYQNRRNNFQKNPTQPTAITLLTVTTVKIRIETNRKVD